jgi:hypothetical protein
MVKMLQTYRGHGKSGRLGGVDGSVVDYVIWQNLSHTLGVEVTTTLTLSLR